MGHLHTSKSQPILETTQSAKVTRAPISFDSKNISKLLKGVGPYFETVKKLFTNFSAEQIHSVGRWDFATSNGHNYYMPAMPIGNFGGDKIIYSRPENLTNGLGLERSQSFITIRNNQTGQVMYTLPGTEIAALKTALITTLALENWITRLNVQEISLGIIGGGNVSREHLRASLELFGPRITDIKIYSPRKSGQGLAKEFESEGAEFTNLDDLLSKSNVIISSTSSQVPIVNEVNLNKKGPVFIAGVGFNDLDVSILEMADLIISEDPIGYLKSSLPLKKFLTVGGDQDKASPVVTLSDLVQNKPDLTMPTNPSVTLFMPFGTATVDLAVALSMLSLSNP